MDITLQRKPSIIMDRIWQGYDDLILVGLLNLVEEHSTQCSVKPQKDFDNYVIWYSMKSKIFFTPRKWETLFKKQLYDAKCRFIFQYFYIQFPDGDEHACMLIIDKKRKTIERYDPHGMPKSFFYKHYEIMDEKFQEYFIDGQYIQTYISPRDVCPIGYQWRQEGEKDADQRALKHGHCVVWSLWYANMRLSYPDLDPYELNQRIDAKFKEYERKGLSKSNFIKNYGKFIMSLKSELHIDDRLPFDKKFSQIIRRFSKRRKRK